MKIKTSRWTFLVAIIFTINSFYWYWKHPDDFVGTVIYLSSKASDYVTGQSIVVDGGWTAAL